MAGLSVRLLGPLQITLDGDPATGFVSDKVRALLAYLCVEVERPHRREKLAGLLWPDWPEQSARANLRQALANLRQVIRDRHATPPYLHTSRQTLQFNSTSESWIDVTAFAHLTAPGPSGRPAIEGTIDELEKAVALYRGEFLEGFSLPDSPSFEEWALLKREQLRRLVTENLHRLAEYYEQRGEYQRGLEHAWRQVELDPWREQAHQQLMRLLALSGQRGAALAQYETCRSLLAEELGVQPGEETVRLYEQIRDGALTRQVERQRDRGAVPARPVTRPRFFEEEPPQAETPLFVAREHELAKLDGFLDMALSGQGRVAFVTGEAGSGKTALVQAFARRAQERHPDLIVAGGNCNAYAGIGDPYLPFREILDLLTGDVESRWAAGAITSEHARRLWDTLPQAAQALQDAGPDLIGTFVLRSALLQRAARVSSGAGASTQADWLTRLDEPVEQSSAGHSVSRIQQSAMFAQYTSVLQKLALRAPLVLLIDDLQWADAGSINLLFHLGRRLARSPILVVGTYRAEEVAIGRDGQRHPLEPVVHEFQRDFGEITVNLSQAETGRFVHALLDSEPNQLGSRFRDMLHRQTRGHPLFTIELLRGLQERGDLIQDPEGRWVEGPALDLETLPARVEAVIAERIGRLPKPLQGVLRAASVEGEVFTAEVVARVQATDESEMVGRLSGELDRKHRLVRAEGIIRTDGRRLSRYRFRHILFQTYLYNSLDQVERAQLHEAVGDMLRALYRRQPDAMEAIAGQLARHFEEAGNAEKAIPYLRQAGERAVRLSAYQEGIALLTRGLTLLNRLRVPGGEDQRIERARQELALQLALGMACVGSQAYTPQGERAYNRARELSQQLGETAQLCLALGRLSIFHYVRSEHKRARELAEEALKEHAEELKRLAKDKVPIWSDAGIDFGGEALVLMGQVEEGMAQMREGIAAYESRGLRFFLSGRLGRLAEAQSRAGHPDEALNTLDEALALVEDTGERQWEAELHRVRGELLLAQGNEEEGEAGFHRAIRVARRQQGRSWELRATVSLCRLWQQQGRLEEARQRLVAIYSWFTEGFDTQDLIETRALLEELSS